jgi:hypothetical protein
VSNHQVADICVVHLVWKPLGLLPLRNFLSSYKQNSGGLPHRLVILFNGFNGEDELGPYHAEMEGLPYEWLMISPATQDIPAYFAAAKRFDSGYFCFLNSYSMLLDNEWLAKMYAYVSLPDVGLVGATASWASHYSIARWVKGIPSSYDAALSDLKEEHLRRIQSIRRRAVFHLSEGLKQRIRSMPLSRRIAYSLYYHGAARCYYTVTNSLRFYSADRREKLERLKRFPASDYEPYPAAHLRTNAFMIPRRVMLNLKTWDMPTKDDAYQFEGGRMSLTNQVIRMGLKVLVVGRDSRGYEKEEWAQSETFWQGQQGNLLVSDNMTRQYEEGDSYTRTFLSRFAWGQQAAPYGHNKQGARIS